jgi:Cellulose synthase subunit D
VTDPAIPDDPAPTMPPLQWRGFLRALAAEIDGSAGRAAREAMLHSVGVRMAQMLPLPGVESIDALQIEMNEALAAIGWGSVVLELSEPSRYLTLTHTGLPRIGAAGEPPGTWLAACLVGLYETWITCQPGGSAGLKARLQSASSSGTIVLQYGRF